MKSAVQIFVRAAIVSWLCIYGVLLIHQHVTAIIRDKFFERRDAIDGFLSSLEGPEKIISPRQTLNFLTDLNPKSRDYNQAYFLTQYALAPSLVAKASDSPWYLYVPKNSTDTLADVGSYRVIKKFDQGILLLKKR